MNADNDTEGESFDFAFTPSGPVIVPYFAYRDAAAAIAFLTDVVGFEALSRYDGPDGAVMHAELHLGDGVVMLGSLPADAPDDLRPGPSGTYVVVEDVDAHHARAVENGLEAKGGTLVHAPEDTPFGTRRYRLLDPEGFEWSFGTYQPSLTA